MTQASLYQEVCQQAELTPVTSRVDVQQFISLQQLSETHISERVTVGLHTLLQLLDEDNEATIDRSLVDFYIAKIDRLLSQQLDKIIHHDAFNQLNACWQSLKYLVDHSDTGNHCKIELLDIDKEELLEDFEESACLGTSGLYKHVYIDEYDTPGGEPITTMLSNYEFNSDHRDITLLDHLAQLGSQAHCPFFASVGPEFFHKKTMDEVLAIEDDETYFERAEFIKWNQFRQKDYARYIGLTMPRFLLRMPYGHDNPVTGFSYQEYIDDISRDLSWGSAVFPFAVNMMRSFNDTGWLINIRGPSSGGKVDNFPIHHYQTDYEFNTIIPTESLIPESKELALSNLGFIPLCYYKHSDFACFFSANSIQKAKHYHDQYATANARVNARLPYVMLISRLGHYLKVLQRENIGSSKSPTELESELNQWLQTLVTKMSHPTPDIIARHPLREASISVTPIIDNPGYFHVSLHVMPHFQVEGVDIQLSLLSQMPAIADAT